MPIRRTYLDIKTDGKKRIKDNTPVNDFSNTSITNAFLDIIAPEASVLQFGNSVIKGRIYAKNIVVNGQFYYDKSLDSLNCEWNVPPKVLVQAHLVEN